jgi:DtxR family Mn-dependent transcriptional regulator
METALSAQMEDYLEAISNLCRDGGVARVRDIARRLEVSTASVVGALRSLKDKGLAEQEPYGYVSLTDSGGKAASSVVHRHEVLRGFLENVLGLDPGAASEDACRIEHAVSPETLARLAAMAEFLLGDAHEDLDWPREFRKFCGNRRKKKP